MLKKMMFDRRKASKDYDPNNTVPRVEKVIKN